MNLLDAWTVHLRARGVSPRTLSIYLGCIRRMLVGLDPLKAKTRDLEAAMVRLADGGASPAYLHQHYRVAKTFFRWLVAEEEIDVNPVNKLRSPIVPQKLVPVVTTGDLDKLLTTCKGRDFRSRRDNAMIRFLSDTGCRRGEAAGMMLSDIDPAAGAAIVLGKGRKPRPVYFTEKTSEAITRYLRARDDKWPHLWIGRQGPMQGPSIYRMLKTRGERVGVNGLYPHRLRHSFADTWLSEGGNETDLMRLAGWSSRKMLEQYGASAADRRAAAAYRRVKG